MTNETNGLSSAILGLVAAFEAERKAFEIAYKIMEQRIIVLENRSELTGNDFEDRIIALETANRIRAEIAGTDEDRHDDLVAKLDELERTVERIDGRVDDLENKDDDDAIREAVESMLESASISISL